MIPGLILCLVLSLSVLPARLREGQGTDIVNLAGSQTMILILCFTCWLTIMYMLKKPGLPATWMKVVAGMILCGLLSDIFYFTMKPVFEDYPMPYNARERDFRGVAALFSRGILIGIMLMPAAYYLENHKMIKKINLELEQMRAEFYRAQITVLNARLDPHFLFNSMSLLKAGTNESWVKQFVMELTHVYRYFLKHTKESPLTSVHEELEFLDSYVYILRQRFGEAFRCEINVSKEVRKQFIPPLSLQLLVENVVKHNELLPESPLTVRIYDEANLLIVKNEKKPRLFGPADDASGSGLKSLKDRYWLLSGKTIAVEDGDDFFIVKIPALKEEPPVR